MIGTQEIQECLKGESEINLQDHMTNCTKNPGHTAFIPVNKFSLDNLPNGYKDKYFVKVTQALSDLTVRVAVNFVSPRRPEFIPGTQEHYAGYKSRGQNLLMTGTGRIYQVIQNNEGVYGNRACPCPECDLSGTPSKVWWEVEVRTARHVVFDESEVKQSSCRLWFDDDNSPVVKIYGWEVGDFSTEEDSCGLYYVTHELHIAKTLERMLAKFLDVSKNLSVRRQGSDLDKLTIIVSHPHGCSKQVSVGQWMKREELRTYLTRFTYTNCTCPGSSGAQVYRRGWALAHHPHSTALSDGLNSGMVRWEG
ncbi:uncharacterized protein LOC131944210 [Physella acuta]|uniref:uncharacterized protein LOC131944210 n=1 Tax=Physella acuta TaxID=109671 RepID=UPI0027DC47A5|nr:uncharacterized protein LOC131944210 [Physella acuta]